MNELLSGSPEVKPYDGNWTEIQASRTFSEDFISKLWIFNKLNGVFNDDNSPPPAFLSNYVELHHTVTSVAGYSIAPDGLRHALGRAKYGSPAHIYSDATHFGRLLTDKQKDIIAAHETYHGLVNAQGKAVKQHVWQGFNFQNLTDKQLVFHGVYISDPNELMARMAQLKNYFGMKNDELFTNTHLEYAKENYIPDTNLDNRMTLFFRAINQDNQNFMDLMNRLPL